MQSYNLIWYAQLNWLVLSTIYNIITTQFVYSTTFIVQYDVIFIRAS